MLARYQRLRHHARLPLSPAASSPVKVGSGKATNAMSARRSAARSSIAALALFTHLPRGSRSGCSPAAVVATTSRRVPHAPCTLQGRPGLLRLRPGRSATSALHVLQYTPASAPVRTHKPPHPSHTFNSRRKYFTCRSNASPGLPLYRVGVSRLPSAVDRFRGEGSHGLFCVPVGVSRDRRIDAGRLPACRNRTASSLFAPLRSCSKPPLPNGIREEPARP